MRPVPLSRPAARQCSRDFEGARVQTHVLASAYELALPVLRRSVPLRPDWGSTAPEQTTDSYFPASACGG
jgi:hypothetical protein